MGSRASVRSVKKATSLYLKRTSRKVLREDNNLVMAKPPLYVKIKSGRIKQSRPLNGAGTIVVDFNDKLEIVGIEILDYHNVFLNGKNK